ncbi:MAG: dTDP-4-dehydrorhamnose 3,5-epimerase family protein [Fusobacteriaceae bacterium]|nr:dTDP-4-dehydrorhamnose 3,5-epimerase family protein [Fusobacteriaceae bacterium]
MKIIATEIIGVYIVENFHAKDNRGSFTKTFHRNFFNDNNLCCEFSESYFSINNKNVIRGMHFQLPPYDHEKLVYVPKGKILDVVLDLRKNSKTYGKAISVELSSENFQSIYIPKGCAHGFKSLEDDTITVYNVATVYNQENDFGLHYNSFGFDWEIEKVIISERDSNFISFNQFKEKNPF